MKKSTLSLLFIVLIISVSMTFSGAKTELNYRLKQYVDRDTVTADYVLNHMNLTVMYIGKDSQYDGDEYKVTGYELMIAPKVGEAEGAIGSSDLLPEIIKSRLLPGSKILFQNIKFTRNDGSKELIKQSMFIIK